MAVVIFLVVVAVAVCKSRQDVFFLMLKARGEVRKKERRRKKEDGSDF